MGREVYAFCGTIDHMALSGNFYGPVADFSPGKLRMKGCESIATHLRSNKNITEENPARHFSGSQQTLRKRKLDNVYWSPVPEKPADRPPRPRLIAIWYHY